MGDGLIFKQDYACIYTAGSSVIFLKEGVVDVMDSSVGTSDLSLKDHC